MKQLAEGGGQLGILIPLESARINQQETGAKPEEKGKYLYETRLSSSFPN